MEKLILFCYSTFFFFPIFDDNDEFMMINDDFMMINDDFMMINDDFMMLNDDFMMINDDYFYDKWWLFLW